MSETERNDADYVRESVIEDVRSGNTEISRSGAWLAERRETGEIELYRHEETIEE